MCSVILIYANDVVLQALSHLEIQVYCKSFGNEFTLEYNSEKCETMIFGQNQRKSLYNYMLNT